MMLLPDFVGDGSQRTFYETTWAAIIALRTGP